MAWMEILAPAKLNLFLELINRRSDGFHELETVMAPIDLYDRILMRRRTDDQIKLTRAEAITSSQSHLFEVPLDQTNLIWKALNLLKAHSDKTLGVDVQVQKGIPSQAGMGGGSSDAASTLLAANRMFALNLSRDTLIELASQLGSDVAFFIDQQPARCTGRGEIIEPLRNFPPLNLVVTMPPGGLSTAAVFKNSSLPSTHHTSQPLIKGLRQRKLQQICRGMWNRLQSAAEAMSPWVSRLKNEFSNLPCMGHQMTGSGTAYFGVFPNASTARRSEMLLKNRLPNCISFCVNTIARPTHLMRYPQT